MAAVTTLFSRAQNLGLQPNNIVRQNYKVDPEIAVNEKNTGVIPPKAEILIKDDVNQAIVARQRLSQWFMETISKLPDNERAELIKNDQKKQTICNCLKSFGLSSVNSGMFKEHGTVDDILKTLSLALGVLTNIKLPENADAKSKKALEDAEFFKTQIEPLLNSKTALAEGTLLSLVDSLEKANVMEPVPGMRNVYLQAQV